MTVLRLGEEHVAEMDHVHLMSRQDASSEGVTLTTEDPANVPLYEHFGYRVVGHARLSPELDTWGFFRPEPAQAGRV